MVTSGAVDPEAEPTPDPVVDPTLVWAYIAPIPSPLIRKRVLVFRQVEYILSNWSGDQFPSVIYLCLDQTSPGGVGYRSKNNQ